MLNAGINIHPLTSLVVQWLRLCIPMEEVWVQSLVRELRVCMPQVKIPHAAKKIQDPIHHYGDPVWPNKQTHIFLRNK